MLLLLLQQYTRLHSDKIHTLSILFFCLVGLLLLPTRYPPTCSVIGRTYRHSYPFSVSMARVCPLSLNSLQLILTKSADILAILLTINTSITNSPIPSYLSYFSPIARTITALSKLCSSYKDHHPMTVPELPSKSTRASPLVQIYSGIAGLL